MGELATGSVDLIITSPPYWNLKDYKHPKQLGKSQTYKHFLYVLKQNLIECMRVLKEDSFACFIVGDIRTSKYSSTGRPKLYSLQSSLIHFLTEEMDLDLFSHFIWHKYGIKQGEKESIVYGSVCTGEYKGWAVPPFLYTDLLTEYILVFRKPGMRKRASAGERQRESLNLISKDELREWLDPVWKINSPTNSKHRATFPAELVKRLIRLFSLKGDIILDPFTGTGTTLSTAIEHHRNAIGYELNLEPLEDLIKDYSLKRDNCRFYAILDD